MLGFAGIAARSSKMKGACKLLWYAYKPAQITRTGMSLCAARITPVPSCGDPARVYGRGQTAAAGGPKTRRHHGRWLRGDRPGQRAGDFTAGARTGMRTGRLAEETRRPRIRGRPSHAAAGGARGCGE